MGAAPAASTVMSSTSSAQPTFTFPSNATSSNIVYQYQLKTTRSGTASCTNYDTVSITVYPIVNISITSPDTSICLGQSSTLSTTVSPSGGSYTWTPSTYLNSTTAANVTATPTIASVTTYKVMYNLNGCLDSAYKTVNAYTVQAEDQEAIPIPGRRPPILQMQLVLILQIRGPWLPELFIV